MAVFAVDILLYPHHSLLGVDEYFGRGLAAFDLVYIVFLFFLRYGWQTAEV